MHYAPGRDQCPLPYDPFKSCTVPRPIGWLSTISANGVVNLAPFSQWQNLTFDPRPYREVNFTPAVALGSPEEAEVTYRRYEPGTYRGAAFWDEGDEVEIFLVHVVVPLGTERNTTRLVIQAECGGDLVQTETQY